MPVVLRKSKDWCNPTDGSAVENFHETARLFGSQARWLCQSCILATEDHTEPDKNFPYEQWRDEALNITR